MADDDVTEEELAASEELEHAVPVYGVLAPTGVLSGDKRRIEDEGLTWRDLPLPLRFVKSDVGGHQGAERVATIERIWMDGNLAKWEGTMYEDELAASVVQRLAVSRLGISVDMDQMEATYVDATSGEELDFDALFDEGTDAVLSVKAGRIAAATIVDIPAFQEAWVGIGRWDEEEAEADEVDEAILASAAECPACVIVEEMALHDQSTADEFATWAEENDLDLTGSFSWTASDGTTWTQAEDVLTFAPGTKDGPGWLTHPIDTGRLRRYWTKGPGAAKIKWGLPGDFNRCRAQLGKYIQNPAWLAGTCANLHKVALGIWPGEHALAASAGDPAPAWTLVASGGRVLPADAFLDPEFTALTPLTIDGDRIYGHLAAWGTCHTGLGASVGSNGCITPPNSPSKYAYFRTGVVETDRGDIPVGSITMGTGHASTSLRAQATMEHYDHTGSVVADVAAGEDAFGIWISGMLRDLDDDKRRALKAATLSGDWRYIAGNHELVAALAVNVPGFPIPRVALAASGGRQTALVASGIVEPGVPGLPAETVFSDADMDRFAEAFARAMAKAETTKREKAETLAHLRETVKDKVDPEQLAAIRAAFAVES